MIGVFFHRARWQNIESCLEFDSKFGRSTRDIHIDYRVLQTIQMKLIFICVWAEMAVPGSATSEIQI